MSSREKEREREKGEEGEIATSNMIHSSHPSIIESAVGDSFNGTGNCNKKNKLNHQMKHTECHLINNNKSRHTQV